MAEYQSFVALCYPYWEKSKNHPMEAVEKVLKRHGFDPQTNKVTVVFCEAHADDVNVDGMGTVSWTGKTLQHKTVTFELDPAKMKSAERAYSDLINFTDELTEPVYDKWQEL